jgi:diacylglycerol kinase (ATP)
MNGRRMGTGFQMAPDAKPDDGLFDVVIVRQVSRGRILTLIPHFLKGTQATQPELRTLRAARVTVTALEGVLPSQADGEIVCVDGKQLTMELLPRQIEVICPPPKDS